jgi:hypothetical protein
MTPIACWAGLNCRFPERLQSLFGNEVKYTKRYKLGQLIGGRARYDHKSVARRMGHRQAGCSTHLRSCWKGWKRAGVRRTGSIRPPISSDPPKIYAFDFVVEFPTVFTSPLSPGICRSGVPSVSGVRSAKRNRCQKHRHAPLHRISAQRAHGQARRDGSDTGYCASIIAGCLFSEMAEPSPAPGLPPGVRRHSD